MDLNSKWNFCEQNGFKTKVTLIKTLDPKHTKLYSNWNNKNYIWYKKEDVLFFLLRILDQSFSFNFNFNI